MTFGIELPLGINLGLVICLVIETIVLLVMGAKVDDYKQNARRWKQRMNDTEFSCENKIATAVTRQREAERKLEQYKQEMREVLKYDPVVEEAAEEVASWIKEEQAS